MKPTKNQFFCFGCQRTKMLFGSKQEAVRFLKYNADEVEQTIGKRPVRAYYCRHCGGWHVTSKKYSFSYQALVRRFGIERGEELFNKVSNFIGKHNGIGEGLLCKIKELRHILKFQRIDEDRCRKLIYELLGTFEIVIESQLEEKNTIDILFKKFSTLCSVFLEKNRLATISA